MQGQGIGKYHEILSDFMKGKSILTSAWGLKVIIFQITDKEVKC